MLRKREEVRRRRTEGGEGGGRRWKEVKGRRIRSREEEKRKGAKGERRKRGKKKVERDNTAVKRKIERRVEWRKVGGTSRRLGDIRGGRFYMMRL